MLYSIKVPNRIVNHYNQSSWLLKDHAETIQFGESLVSALDQTNIVLLDGPLGAGKTSLVKGIAKGLLIKEPITSPTFALSHHYLKGQRALIHLDLYRLEKHLAADELFLQEEETSQKLGGLMVVEWPSRLSLNLSDACIFNLNYSSTEGRVIQLISSKEDKN